MTAGNDPVDWLKVVKSITNKACKRYPRIASDVIESAAWLAVGQADSKYRPVAGASRKTWLYKKAPYLLIDELRRTGDVPRLRPGQKRPFTLLETDCEGSYVTDCLHPDGFLEVFSDGSSNGCPFSLEELVEGLSAKDRVIVSLYFEHGYKLKKVGEALGITESAASLRMTSLLTRQRERLMEKFPKELEGWE